MQNFHALLDAVQKNCYITDARHARDMTLCTYLLEMRQYYRWEHEMSVFDIPPKDDLGNWLVTREKLWDQVETCDYEHIPAGTQHHEPFDSESINRELIPQGYVYSAGLGRFRKPHFFLGQLLQHEQRHGFTILVSGCEYARDLIAPPAAMQNRTIFLRRESVRRMLWEKIEEWQWKKQAGPMERVLSHYNFEQDPEEALDLLTDAECEAMILHELGEGLVGDKLGEAWETMLLTLSSKKPEIMARAVRDNLADCLSTLPELIQRQAHASIHFYFANFDGMRKQLFPAALKAYENWVESGDISSLQDVVDQGREHWERIANALLANADPADGDKALERTMEENHAIL